MKENIIHKTQCRICAGSDLIKVLDLGKMPLANAFLEEGALSKTEEKFPLVVYFCKNCALLQLLDVVNPEILFRHYDYCTSASKPLADHFRQSGEQLAARFVKSPGDLVVEIGGNDGVLLAAIKDKCRALNIEPARNIADISRQKGIETINDFFSDDLAGQIVRKYGSARLVVANNVIAHIDDIKNVFAGVKNLLADDGAFVFEAHWVGNLIGEGGFDQIYHEHLCYFSLSSLSYLTKQFGLEIFDVELVPIHGQSMRVYVGKEKNKLEAVDRFLEEEKKLGLLNVDTFLKFAARVENNSKKLHDLLVLLKSEGKMVVGYGAPAKGNTLLNYYKIDASLTSFIIDTTPLKQGLYTPGSRIKIYPPCKLKETRPDYLLLLAWNYADAIMANEKEFSGRGGKFIIPVPDVKVV